MHILLHTIKGLRRLDALDSTPMHVRGNWLYASLARLVAVNACCWKFSLQHGLAASVGIVLDKASSASLCVKLRKPTAVSRND